jgi:hypothetical protein
MINFEVFMINFSRGRGRLVTATRKWADSLGDGSDLPGSALILVELARDAANLADSARNAGDGRLYLSAAARLEALMVRCERAVSGDGGGGAAGDGVDDLADVMGAGPEVRDSPES